MRLAIDELAEPSAIQTIEESLAILTAVIPGVGGPVSAYLADRASERKMNRFAEVLVLVAQRIDEVGSEVAQDYVRTEDFEELFEETMLRVTRARSEEKRRLYASFLIHDITHPAAEPFDEKLRFLRTLEDLQPAHMVVVHALLAETDEDLMMGSPITEIAKRLPAMAEATIEERIGELAELGLVIQNPSLRTMMTGHGAQKTAHFVTPYGRRLVAYLEDGESLE
jgi:hypothetical protein